MSDYSSLVHEEHVRGGEGENDGERVTVRVKVRVTVRVMTMRKKETTMK